MLDFIREHLGPIVAIVFTLIALSIGIAIWGSMSGGLDDANKSITDMTSRLSNEAYTSLDERDDITGSTVISFVSEHGTDDKFIVVKGANISDIKIQTSDGSNYDPSSVSAQAKSGALSDVTKIVAGMKSKSNANKCYINPSWTFHASVTYNSDKTVAGIVFERN